MNFKQLVRLKRLEKGRTLKIDAEEFGKTISYLSVMENGKQPVSDEYIEFVSKIYEISREEILKYLIEKPVIYYYSV